MIVLTRHQIVFDYYSWHLWCLDRAILDCLIQTTHGWLFLPHSHLEVVLKFLFSHHSFPPVYQQSPPTDLFLGNYLWSIYFFPFLPSYSDDSVTLLPILSQWKSATFKLLRSVTVFAFIVNLWTIPQPLFFNLPFLEKQASTFLDDGESHFLSPVRQTGQDMDTGLLVPLVLGL